MTLDYSKLKEAKITIPVVVLLGLFWVGFNAKAITVDALGEFFIHKAAAEDQYQQLAAKIETNQTVIVSHIQEYKLNENARETRAITNELYNLELFESANGVSQLTQDRKRQLTEQLQTLARKRACVIRNANLPEGRTPENCDAIA